MALRVIDEHRTPDGLTFRVGETEDGDTCLGFDGYSWHTHGDVVAELSGKPEAAAIRMYVDDLLAGRSKTLSVRAMRSPSRRSLSPSR